MGFLRRIVGAGSVRRTSTRPVVVIDGLDNLEVVGESNYQDALRGLVGARRDRVRLPVQATLVAEANNRWDSNAISVWIAGSLVGYLSRDDAAAVRPGLLELERRHGASIALPGVIVGGGEATPSYGVFLNLDATAFGLAGSGRAAHVRGGREAHIRTGLSNALVNDAANDTYDLGWQSGLPDDTLKAIAFLRARLATETEPVGRHFMFAALGERLYGARDQFGSALPEFDAVCRNHDAEMGTIRPALIKTFGGLPLLELYRQAAIRHQKVHDWATAVWWARRGLEVYGSEAINPEVIADLTRRVETYAAKLAPGPPGLPRLPRPRVEAGTIEVLECRTCGQRFERERTRGRKPNQCPACRGVA
jgi:hypothetical protein